jgi:hypothetical protein
MSVYDFPSIAIPLKTRWSVLCIIMFVIAQLELLSFCMLVPFLQDG